MWWFACNISAMAEAGDFEFGTQLEFANYAHHTVKSERLNALVLVSRSAETTCFRCLSVAAVLAA